MKPSSLKDLVRSERCQPQSFVGAEGVDLPEQVLPILQDFSRESALSLCGDPAMNPMGYFFDPEFENKAKYPWPESNATIIQLFEILIACGHAGWICGELAKRRPRLAVIAALSGHPDLLEAASAFFSMKE